jgi:hypothetical protein
MRNPCLALALLDTTAFVARHRNETKSEMQLSLYPDSQILRSPPWNVSLFEEGPVLLFRSNFARISLRFLSKFHLSKKDHALQIPNNDTMPVAAALINHSCCSQPKQNLPKMISSTLELPLFDSLTLNNDHDFGPQLKWDEPNSCQTLVGRCKRDRTQSPMTVAYLEFIDIAMHENRKDEKAFLMLKSFVRNCPHFLRVQGERIRDHLKKTDEVLQRHLSRQTMHTDCTNESLPEAISFLLYMRSKRQRPSKTLFLLIASCLEGRGILYRHANRNPTSQYSCYHRVYKVIFLERP